MTAALIAAGVLLAGVLLYAAARFGDRPGRGEARQFEASLDAAWQKAPPAPEAHHEWNTAPAVTAPPDPPAGDGNPGPGGLPEGDTQLLWPPQETAGPGDLLTRARAAMDEIAALDLDDYLTEVAGATAYTDNPPFTGEEA